MKFAVIFPIFAFCAFVATADWSSRSHLLGDQIFGYRLSASMTGDGNQMDISILAKNRDQLRTTLKVKNSPIEITLIHKDGQLYRTTSSPSETKTEVLQSDEAARQLFEIITLNPAYHLESDLSVYQQTRVFDGYSIVYKFKENSNSDAESPHYARLHRESETDSTLIHSALFFYTNPSKELGHYPTKVRFKNEVSNDPEFTISVNKIEYNPGLPDFLFEINDPEGNEHNPKEASAPSESSTDETVSYTD